MWGDVGTTLTLYSRCDMQWEICDHGEKHLVTIVHVKRVTVLEVWEEMIPFLAYDRPEVGTKRRAVDAQGRTYEFTPYWDGPGSWRRDRDGRMFSHRMPPGVVRDATGRRIALPPTPRV